MPMIRAYFVPRERVEFLDNWDVMGLAGTGSYDYEVPEQTIHEDFTFDLINAEPRRGGPVYRLGVLGLTAAGHAAFALGVGRHGMDELTRIVQTKHRLGADPLRDQQLFRHDYAMHDAALLAARAFVFESFATVQDVLDAGDDPSPVQRQRLRQATTYATRVATDAVRFAYTAAGTDALRPGALQRCFRDLHAVDPAPRGRQQHAHRDDPRAARPGRLTCSDLDELRPVAVVTGAASGIGRSLAGRLTVEGMHVVLADVEEGALRDAVAGIGGDAVAVHDRRDVGRRRSRRWRRSPTTRSARCTCCATTRACSRAGCCGSAPTPTSSGRSA